MKLIFLGTGGFHPNERRHTAGLLLPEIGVAFDAGTSAFRIADRLVERSLNLFLTHAHLDHICGLSYLLVPLIQNRIDRCTVWGNQQTLAAVETHLFSEPVFPVKPRFELRELTDRIAVPSGVVTHHPLHHPGGSLGYRFDGDDGRSFAYITDTITVPDYVDFIRGVDVLIHECYFPDSDQSWCEPTGHSHTSAVARQAATANVQRLYLTHIDPNRPDDDPIGLATAHAIFPATELAEDLLEIDV
ncbi:MAG: MBL fold metallo-hydrolase [Planctomycetaceae bacterium]|nr:MBL fold metallo-hydrolase [Planctomycetaceae bacterium]